MHEGHSPSINCNINIDGLREAELIALNLRVVARLRLLWQSDARNAMRQFKIGDKVSVSRAGRAPLTGVVTRYNKNTVSVVTADGQRWNISPWLLKKMRARGSDPKSNVIQLVPRARRKP
jgi:hypothetical protein